MEIKLGKYTVGFYVSISCKVCQVERIASLINISTKIGRIKAVRSLEPVSLREAKEFVEKNFANNGIGKKLCGHKG